MDALKLHDQKHPDKHARQRFDNLIAIDQQKEALLDNLLSLFVEDRFSGWQKKHHPQGLRLLDHVHRSSPLIILSGDVGCGKTELASCIGTPLSDALGGKTVRTFETPSDTRGSGKVGELSARITSAFRQACQNLKANEFGILLIDEADDLATERSQEHAHHEDRAGVNALIKEIDRLEKDKTALVVLLISNRTSIMDPAIRRRASADIRFVRPLGSQLQEILEYLLRDVAVQTDELKDLVQHCEAMKPLFTFSDFFTRISRQAVISAHQKDVPLSAAILRKTIESIHPSPEIIQS